MVISRHFPKYQELDQLVMEGRAQMIGTPTTDTGTTPAMVAPQTGEVAIITRVVSTVYPGNDTSPGLSDTGVNQGLALYDENGDITYEGFRFISFQRVNAAMAYSPSAEEAWRSAVPNNPLVWDLEQPLIVPPKHTLRAAMDGAATLAGGVFAVRGYIVDIGTARKLGFNCNTQDLTYKTVTANGIMLNTQGFRGGNTDLAVELVPGKTGYCIQVIDLNMRIQPLAGGTTTRHASLVGAIDLTEAALENDLLTKLVNNNHGDMAELQIAPGWYADTGDGVWIVGGAPGGGTRCSASLTYRYVPNEEVPEGIWRVCTTPGFPSPGSFAAGTDEKFRPSGQVLTVKYPGRAAMSRPSDTLTASTAGTGYQHVVEGYVLAGQKDDTITSDRLYIALASGATAGGVGLSGSGLTTTNELISPIVCLGSHNQMLCLAEDGLNVPVLKETGAVILEMTATGSGSTTPAASDLDVDELFVTVWGRTIPAQFTQGHFQGAAS